jgi:hypothetical protein
MLPNDGRKGSGAIIADEACAGLEKDTRHPSLGSIGSVAGRPAMRASLILKTASSGAGGGRAISRGISGPGKSGDRTKIAMSASNNMLMGP